VVVNPEGLLCLPGGPWAFCAGGPGAEGFEGPEWKKVSAKRFGIEESMIPAEAWNVLHRLRSRGAASALMGPASVWFICCGQSRILTVEVGFQPEVQRLN